MTTLETAEREWLAIKYLRISDLTDTSTSIPRQDKDTNRRVLDLGGRVVSTFQDVDKSGYHTYVKRPGWDDALKAIRQGLGNLLIVFKVDRATRQGIPQAAEIIRLVYETGCRFMSIMDGIDSLHQGWELQLVFAADQAHKESKNTSGRVANMRADERDEGRWMGHRPYGWIVTPERKLRPHPVEAPRVRKMWELACAGKSRRAIASYANRHGWDSPRWASRKLRIEELEAKGEPLKAEKLRQKPLKYANSWGEKVIGQLLVSPTMIGYLPHKGEIYRHSVTGQPMKVMVDGVEPVLTISQWSHIKVMWGERVPWYHVRAATPGTRSAETQREVNSLLVDYLYCGECGSRMEHDSQYRRKGKVLPRYRCQRRADGGDCPGSLMYAEHADRLVAEAVLARISSLDHDDPVVIAIAERWAAQQNPERVEQRLTLEKLIHEEEKFLEQLEEEKLKGTMFKGKRGEERFRKKYDTANDRLEALEAELDAIPPDEALNVGFVDHLELLVESWKVSPLHERREFLALGVEKVWLHKARKVGVRPSADRFTYWYPGEPEPLVGASHTLSDDSKTLTKDQVAPAA